MNYLIDFLFWHSNSPLISCSCLLLSNDRWDGRGLTGHSEVIFKALDNLVNDIAGKYIHQQGGECDIAKILQDMVRLTVYVLCSVVLDLAYIMFYCRVK